MLTSPEFSTEYLYRVQNPWLVERLVYEAIKSDNLIRHGDYGNTGCGVFKRGYKLRKVFAYSRNYITSKARKV